VVEDYDNSGEPPECVEVMQTLGRVLTGVVVVIYDWRHGSVLCSFLGNVQAWEAFRI
jgi:hypothetical protein